MNDDSRYLILDRSDPDHPHWVIAQAVQAIAADVPADLNSPDKRWLRDFDWDLFDWMRSYTCADLGVEVPRTGREGFVTRLYDWSQLPSATGAATQPEPCAAGAGAGAAGGGRGRDNWYTRLSSASFEHPDDEDTYEDEYDPSEPEYGDWPLRWRHPDDE